MSEAQTTANVAIVGAGPAGMAAARVLASRDIPVTVIDEQPRRGGQILRPPPEQFTVTDWLRGSDYEDLKTLLREAEHLDPVQWRTSTTVVGVLPGPGDAEPHTLWLRDREGLQTLSCTHLILAQGCYERPVPFPGWTTPGVMGAGAIQTLLKSQRVLPGRRVLLSGSHPLQLVVADQIVAAGGEVAGVLFAQPMSRALRLLRSPRTALRHRRELATVAGVLQRLRRAGVPVHFQRSVIAVRGDDCVSAAVVARLDAQGAPIPGSETEEPTECVGICYGFVASTELARQAGVDVQWDANNGGWLAQANEHGKTNVDRLFVIGELTGQAGAHAAVAKAEACAHALVDSLGRQTSTAAELSAKASALAHRWTQFARILNQLAAPPEPLLEHLASPETTLCRCECVSCGAFEDCLSSLPAPQTADAVKLISRVGMGPCQGRMCYAGAVRMMERVSGRSPAELGPFHATLPIKPIPLDVFSPEQNRRADET